MKKARYKHVGVELLASFEVPLIGACLKEGNACCEREILRLLD